MSEAETPSPWTLMAANQDQPEAPPIVADLYWQDISLQAAARLERLEQAAAEDDIDYLQIDERFGAGMRRLMLMVAVGLGLYASVTYLLLNDLRLPAVSAGAAPIVPSTR